MKNQKGITLITLILTVIIILLLASIGVYTGVEAYKTMKVQKFMAQMRVVQERINVICEDWKNWEKYNDDTTADPNNFNLYIEETLISPGGQKARKANATSQPEFNEIISGDTTSLTGADKTITNYYYFSSEDLESFLGLKGLDIEVIINFASRNFVEKTGVEALDTEGNIKRYYVLEELIEAQRLTSTIIQNLNSIENDVIIDYYKYLNTSISKNNGTNKTILIELNAKVEKPIKKLEISKENVSKPEDIIKWEEIEDYQISKSGITVQVNENGDFSFKITDNKGQVFYSKEPINIELANAPELEIGMTPIFFENGKIIETNINDPKWYNYSKNKKEWANVKLEDGSIYVWIPRFAYKIDNIDKTIQIKFLYEAGSFEIGKESLENGFKIHPAFSSKSTGGSNSNYKNGEWNDEISGIWVAKFNANIFTENSEEFLTITYGEEMTRITDLSKAINICRRIETKSIYGFEKIASGELRQNLSFENDNNRIDSHLIKNSEMGAVLYLAYSSYGNSRNDIKDNNTSIAGGSRTESEVFNIRKDASTTGNAYGIYDLLTTIGAYVSAGLWQGEGSENLTEEIGKYFTKYNNYSETNIVVGDGIYDLSAFWNQDMQNNYPNIDNPIFIRGNDIKNIFSYSRVKSENNEGYYVRPVIIVER